MVRDDGDGGSFGACSACCGDCYDGRVVARMAWCVVNLICVDVRVYEEECHGFGGIDSGTSPNADDKIDA